MYYLHFTLNQRNLILVIGFTNDGVLFFYVGIHQSASEQLLFLKVF